MGMGVCDKGVRGVGLLLLVGSDFVEIMHRLMRTFVCKMVSLLQGGRGLTYRLGGEVSWKLRYTVNLFSW